MTCFWTEAELLCRDKLGNTLLINALNDANNALLNAILSSSACTAKVLLAQNNRLENAYMMAARRGLSHQLNKLLSHRNCPGDALSPGISLLRLAIPFPSLSISLVSMMQQYLRLNNRPTNALSLAVIEGRVDCIKLMVRHWTFSKIILFEKDLFGYNALEYANLYNRFSIFSILNSI
ncbi:TPA: hypothetical protein JBJ46_15085 [Legionella pneumophila]|nr:hypothetical protein [Legionella pneumophila]